MNESLDYFTEKRLSGQSSDHIDLVGRNNSV
jgi:hypothetical protein